jgi:ribonuclease HII
MPPDVPTYALEATLVARGLRRIAGLDEAGRGPLAGPVVAAAVVLDAARIPSGLADSKQLTARARDRLFDSILAVAETGIGIASVEEIDTINILQASHLAMLRALAALPAPPCHCLIDGPAIPRGLNLPAEGVVRGDTSVVSIAAASILAKVTRDRIMVDLAQQHPQYGWERNMGYCVPEHLEALKCHGATTHHRRSFAPVHNILYQEKSVSH